MNPTELGKLLGQIGTAEEVDKPRGRMVSGTVVDVNINGRICLSPPGQICHIVCDGETFEPDNHINGERLSIPGSYCVHCNTKIGKNVVCRGCGWVDPLTHSTKEDE